MTILEELARIIRAHHVTRQTYDGPGKTRSRRMHSGDVAAAEAILPIITREIDRAKAEGWNAGLDKGFETGIEVAHRFADSAESTLDNSDGYSQIAMAAVKGNSVAGRYIATAIQALKDKHDDA